MPPSGTAAALRQPYAFLAVQAFAGLFVFIVSTGWIWLSSDAKWPKWLVYILPKMLANMLGGLLFLLAIVLLMVHQQRERHRIACFRPMAGMLAAFLLFYLTLSQLWRVAGTALGSIVLSGHDAWTALYSCFYSLVMAAIATALPLWLILRYARARSPRLAPEESAPVAAWQVGLAVALCFSALYFKLIGTVLTALPSIDTQPSDWLFAFVSSLLPFCITWVAVRAGLPVTVSRFAAGRILLTATVLVLLWTTTGLLGMLLASFALVGDGRESPSDALVLLLILLWQVSSWPLSRWSLRWCYRRDVHER